MTTELVELADRPEFTVDEALRIADQNADSYEKVASVSRTLAAEVRRFRALASRAGGSAMIGEMVEVEFARHQITFKMQGNYHCTAGTYEIRLIQAAPEPVAVGL